MLYMRHCINYSLKIQEESPEAHVYSDEPVPILANLLELDPSYIKKMDTWSIPKCLCTACSTGIQLY